jgi:hypothetical protein
MDDEWGRVREMNLSVPVDKMPKPSSINCDCVLSLSTNRLDYEQWDFVSVRCLHDRRL